MYKKEYYQAHKEQHKSYMKAYYESHKEARKASMKALYEANREQRKAYKKSYSQAHREQEKAYKKSDVNAKGETKHSIRMKSQAILKQMNLKIPHYEIHHCFGYEDPNKFIYISKALHLKIHQYLRDNNIDASCDHWMHIRDLVNSVYEFVYVNT